MSIKLTTDITPVPQIPLGQNNPPALAGFSTGNCFWWLHEKNVEFRSNIRGMVNHEYNRLLAKKGLVSNLIPGGEDFYQLGMDTTTSIVRPDLYYQTCLKIIPNCTDKTFAKLNISTHTFFSLLHDENIKCSSNIRGRINQKYNELLLQENHPSEKIPGDSLEQLGLDTQTPLIANLYLKAYSDVIAAEQSKRTASITLQSLIRGCIVRYCCAQEATNSEKRYQVHMRFFNLQPLTAAELSPRAVAAISQLPQIIHKLAKNGAIIPLEVWHITTWDNLSSICKTGFLGGAATLKAENIKFTPNVLCPESDKTDLNTLCLGPNLIDFNTLFEKGNALYRKLKKEVIQIKIDLSEVTSFGKYSQFFKVRDFSSPKFNYALKLTDWLSMGFSAKFPVYSGPMEYIITFEVDQLNGSVKLEDSKNIIYGSLYQANKFCLEMLFNLIEDSKNEPLIKAFYTKFKQCNEAEVTKILKLFGQHLTVFSEVNFHSRLYCREGLITEIYDLNTGKFYSLRNLESDIYQERTRSIALSNFSKLPSSDKKLEMYGINNEGCLTDIFKTQLSDGELYLRDIDYSHVSPEEFMGSQYINYVEDGQKNRAI